MTNQLIPYNEVEQFGKAMVASGFFQDVKQISQAIVKIQAGAEIGLPPFASMTGVHIIKGKPVLGANLIATLIKNDPRYNYRVKRLDNDACCVVFYEGGEIVGESEFTTADASDAGINNQNWQKYPRNMLFARAISNGAKWYTPGIFGGMPVYTPDEFGLAVDEDGDVVEGQVVYHPEPLQKPESEPERPISTQPTRNAETVKAALLEAAAKNTSAANEKQLKFARASLSKLVNANATDAKIILDYVFAVSSSSDLTSGEASAIIDWAGSNKDNGYTPNQSSVIEAAKLVTAANVEAGQEPLFDDEPNPNGAYAE